MRVIASGRVRPYVLGGVLGLLTLGALLIAASLLNASQYGALASTIQAVAVIPAIAIAALTVTNDSRDRRADRVLDLHRELHSGDLEDAKARLGDHLRAHGEGGKVRPTSREELASSPELRKYRGHTSFSPRADLDLLLRFFERADAARLARTMDEELLVELIGRTATWWNLAITGDTRDAPRAHLSELANWANSFALSHQDRYLHLRNWGQNRTREFGHITADPNSES